MILNHSNAYDGVRNHEQTQYAIYQSLHQLVHDPITGIFPPAAANPFFADWGFCNTNPTYIAYYDRNLVPITYNPSPYGHLLDPNGRHLDSHPYYSKTVSFRFEKDVVIITKSESICGLLTGTGATFFLYDKLPDLQTRLELWNWLQTPPPITTLDYLDEELIP